MVALGGVRASLSVILPGFAVAALVAIAAQFMSEHYGAPAMLMALLMGMSLNFLSESGTKTAAGIHAASRGVLRFGVALLGARVSIEMLSGLGAAVIIMTVAAVVLTAVFAVAVGRIARVDWRLALLAGGAVAICGASAAVALNAVLAPGKDGEKNLALTIVAITLLSTAAMVAYPILSAWLQFDAREAGIFIGGTIHDVAQVVGAGFSISQETGEIATLVKMIRVSMLAPVIFSVFLILAITGGARDEQQPRDWKRLLPGFLVCFAVLAALRSFGLLPDAVADLAAEVSRWALLIALAAVGLRTSLKEAVAIRSPVVPLALLATGFLAVLMAAGLLMIRAPG